jgi:predicted secreted hydrolase
VRSSRAALGLLLALAAGAAALWALRGEDERPPLRAGLSVTQALAGGDPTGYRRAEGPRAFRFPDDHGPHPGFRTEWWYWTANLRAADGRRYGVQLTFFRTALAPAPPARRSAWAAGEVYLAHLALTDVAAGRFEARSRRARAALGLAGARAAPFRVWLEGWEAAGRDEGLRLRAREADLALDLELRPLKPVVLQGEGGWSRKGPEPGNASYYYSLTRLAAQGTLQADGERVEVSGLAWMDREWSTSALGPGLAGWDWFALQLEDGRELMLYRLRRRDGSADPWSAGSVVDAAGTARRLGRDEVVVEVLGQWRSPRTGVRYPAGWRIRWPAGDLALEVRPVLAAQELDVGLRYWEGAVDVAGTAAGRPVGGAGYVELVGYE